MTLSSSRVTSAWLLVSVTVKVLLVPVPVCISTLSTPSSLINSTLSADKRLSSTCQFTLWLLLLLSMISVSALMAKFSRKCWYFSWFGLPSRLTITVSLSSNPWILVEGFWLFAISPISLTVTWSSPSLSWISSCKSSVFKSNSISSSPSPKRNSASSKLLKVTLAIAPKLLIIAPRMTV